MIAGPTPAAATRALRDTLQRALSCVTVAVFAPQSNASRVELTLTCPLTLARGGHVTLALGHYYVLVSDAARDARRRWQARTTGYHYAVDDADGREILSYHWHPTGRSHATTPHLHLGAGAGTLRPELTKAHLATGPITPVALLTLLLEHFAVRPRRTDWPAVLERARRALEAP